MGAWANEVFGRLSLEEKVGQVICYRASKWADETIDMARRGLVGCVSPIYYAGMKDLESAVEFMNALQGASSIPILFLSSHACDMRGWGATPFPGEGGSMAFGAARDPDLAYRYGRMASLESKALGFDCVWTPCVDVNTEPRNPIIGTRAFSDRPELVAEMAVAMVKGMQDVRVIPNAKHFPGHGDTAFDTHRQIGVVPHSRERLEAIDFYPYRELVKAGLRGVETAHIIYPALDDTPDLPATLSRTCIYDLLRKGMGFEGLIVSDSLTMKAITDHYSVGDAAIRSFNAGHDILLHDYNEPPEPTFEAMVSAARDGTIPMAELDASVMRVLEHKEWAGLPDRGPISLEEIDTVFGCSEHQALCREIYDASATVLENDALPLGRSTSGEVCIIATCSEEERKGMADFAATVENSRDVLFRECHERLGTVSTHLIDEDPSSDEVEAAVKACVDAETVVFATMPRIVSYKALSGRVGGGQVEVVQKLLALRKTVVLCVFGTPYVLTDFPRTQGCLTTYSSTIAAVEAGVRILFGETESRGKLPISLSDTYTFGYGL